MRSVIQVVVRDMMDHSVIPLVNNLAVFDVNPYPCTAYDHEHFQWMGCGKKTD